MLWIIFGIENGEKNGIFNMNRIKYESIKMCFFDKEVDNDAYKLDEIYNCKILM